MKKKLKNYISCGIIKFPALYKDTGQNSQGGGYEIMKKSYEMMFIILSALTEEQKSEVIAGVEKNLADFGAENISTEKWGERKLAYMIDKKSTGFYVLTKFDIDGTQLVELEKKLNINESIMRYIIVKQQG